MKLRWIVLALLVMGMGMLHTTRVRAATGGPDPYGYIWKDSNEPGISFQWVNIVGRPGAVQVPSLADDNAVGPFNIGWDFHYYWSDYGSVKIGSNGWISFSNVGNIASCFPAVPSAGGGGDNIVAPFMSDLTFISNDAQNPNVGALWYWTNNVDSFVIQWVNVPWWRNATPDWIGSNTFQMILSGADSSITFQYLNTDAANFPGGSGCPTFMEIGIENVTGDLGLNYSSGATVPPDNYAVKYIYPSGASFLVPDATPVWNVDADNAGQFVYAHRPTLLSANIANVGNTPITSQITLAGRVRDLQLVQAWADTSQTTGLANGDDVTLQFLDTLFLPIPGQYYFEVTTETAGGQDINPTNNTNSIEVVSVDNNGGNAMLSFASGFGPSVGVSWAGGNTTDGVAVKMVPPEFPALIDSVQVYITGDGDLQTPPPVGFRIAVHGLDGNGQPDPNNVLGTATVAAGAVVEDAWNTVHLSTTVTVASGGFAVAWMQQGSGIALGGEEFGAISRRSYEILGGAWSSYRNNETTELLVRVFTGLPVAAPSPMPLESTVQVFPNPASTEAQVQFSLLRGGDVDLALVDSQGRIVWQAHHPTKAPGTHLLPLNLEGQSAGLYFLRMRHRDKIHSAKLLIVN
jgi:hypothetical protein